MMLCFAGIDIGTSSTKAILMSEDGTVLGSAQESYPVQRPAQGCAEQDVDELWTAVKNVMRTLAKQYPEYVKQVRCIGLSGQMHSLVMLDRTGTPLRRAIIWADQRSEAEVQQILDRVTPEGYTSVTLNSLSTGFLLSSLVWVRNREPQIFDRTDKVVMIKDYIRYRLCGELGCEASDASSSGVFDVARRDWAWGIIDAMGLPRNIFPPCHEAIDAAGVLTDRAAEETGFPRGIALAYGGGDTLMHEVGTGMIDEDRSWVANIGTSTTFTCAVRKPYSDERFRTNTFCHCKDGLWILMGATLCGGAGISWLRTNVFPGMTIERLNSTAEIVPPGSEGLIFLPYLNGARSPDNDPKAKGMFFGMTLNHNCEHMTRAVLEGIIFSMKNSFELLKSVAAQASERVICSGGGARSKLLLQMQADMFDRPVMTTVGAEQACVGAAITAAVSSGFYSSLNEGCREAVRFNNEIIMPIDANVRRYNELFEIYRSLYDCNKELMAKYH